MKIKDIENWISQQTLKDDLSPSDIAIINTFGFVAMSDGRKAQVQVRLEMDKDDWI